MKINGHELNDDNIQDWSDKTLIADKEKLLTNNEDFSKNLLLAKLIDVELKRREIINKTNSLADFTRKLILKDDDLING